MKPGDPVIYAPSPLLFGEMEVVTVRPKGRVQVIVDPGSKHPTFEIFGVEELEVATVPA